MKTLSVTATLILLFAAPVAADDKRFERVAAILIKNCIRCHHPREKMSELDMSSLAGLLRGGDAGPAIKPGHPSLSAIVKRAENGSMPPINDGPQVPAEDVKLLREWIAAGANWTAGVVLTPQGIHLPSLSCRGVFRRKWVRRLRLLKKWRHR